MLRSTERGYATVSRPSVHLSVRPSVCDVHVCFSHRLDYFENNFTAESLKVYVSETVQDKTKVTMTE